MPSYVKTVIIRPQNGVDEARKMTIDGPYSGRSDTCSAQSLSYTIRVYIRPHEAKMAIKLWNLPVGHPFRIEPDPGLPEVLRPLLDG